MEWFSQWFNQDYLDLYRHRNLDSARKEANFSLKLLGSRPEKLLDIGCGNGRHLFHLAAQATLPVGVDLSSHLLRAADQLLGVERTNAQLVRADMRHLPFRDSYFDAITNFFTSFGYFQSDAEHLALLKEWRRVLSDDALLFMDYLNRELLLNTLVPSSRYERKDVRVSEERSFSKDLKRVEKHIRIEKFSTGEVKEYQESVRAFSLVELKKLFESAGFEPTETFGSFDAEAFSTSSPRLLILARRIPS